MEFSEVQKEADSATRKAMVFFCSAALLAAVFGYWLAQLSRGGPEVQNVVVAAEDIAALSHIELSQLQVVPWPSQAKPKGTFDRADAVIKTNMISVTGLLAGEPILQARLSTVERGLGISQLVAPDMRAFVVQVLDSVALAELLHPRAFVDVLATVTNNKTQDVSSKVLLQNVQILAVGDSIDVEVKKPGVDKSNSAMEDRGRTERHRVVTLMVPLGDVEALTLASRQGKIDLALRNSSDGRIVETRGVRLNEILGDRQASHPSEANAAPVGVPGGAQMRSMLPTQPPAASAHAHGQGPAHRREGSGGPAIYKVRH